MKKISSIRVTAFLAVGLVSPWPASAQTPLERLEAGIRTANYQSAVAVAPTRRVYLGAVADDEAGRGVRVLSVHAGGPADRAGLRPQDLVVGAAGRKIHLFSELTAILNLLSPGDHLTLELLRGNRPLHTEVILAAPPATVPTVPPSLPPPPGSATGRTETIPPPPGEVAPIPQPPAPSDGPALAVPGNPFAPPPPSNSAQAQIDELRHRVEQLERRIQELEREMAQSRQK